MCVISRDMSSVSVAGIDDFIDDNIDTIKFSFTPKGANEKGSEALRMILVHNLD